LDLGEVVVRPVRSFEEPRYQDLMQQHHYLGALPKISETLWYVASWREEWVALLSFSASALKCAARDRWIGWDFRQRYSRLKLVVNNSRFLILPDRHVSNLGSRVLSLCQRRLRSDWEARFGHGVLLLETFVDPQRFRGTVYRAANWVYVGNTRGFRRTRFGYTATPQSPKMVFVQPLQADARGLCGPPSLPLTAKESPKSCSPPRRCNPSPLLFPDSRSPPRPRTATSLVHRAGHGRRGRPMRHARLPGDLRLGAKSRAEVPRALRLPSPRGPLCRAQ
jgi:hypothetical protein